jgi:hypothetical protein
MQRFHTGVIAVALLAGTSLAIAQQEKTQQNSADEALTRSAPEAKDQPQAPGPAKQNEASQPGLQPNSGPAFTDGKLTAPGSPEDTQDTPSKVSSRNDQLDHTPIQAFPLFLTDEQKRAIYQKITEGTAPVPDANYKLTEAVPATLALQELPADLAASMPSVRDYKYLRAADRVLVINPRQSIVVGEITQ